MRDEDIDQPVAQPGAEALELGREVDDASPGGSTVSSIVCMEHPVCRSVPACDASSSQRLAAVVAAAGRPWQPDPARRGGNRRPGQDHDCIVGTPPASIDWSALANPILSYPAVGVKDQALQWSGGAWHMLYSDMTAMKAAPHVHFSVAVSSSPDLRHWSSPKVIADNAASPDIVRSPSGTFIVTYQTPQGLAYRTASNASLQYWSAPHPSGAGWRTG